MSTLKYDDIVKYRDTILDNKDNLDLIIDSYKTKISDINENNSKIKFDDWEDSISVSLSDYKDSLNSGVISKLNNSISNEGSARKLKELIDSLYEQCNSYINNVDGIKARNDAFSLDDTGKIVSSDSAFTQTLVDVNRELNGQLDIIDNTLNELKKLKFDSIVDFKDGYVTIPSIENMELTITPKEPITINQFDIVVVNIDGEEKEMYYLGTDSKGRSYFSESLDKNAKAYRGVLPNEATTAQTYLNDPETYSNPWTADAYASARIGFVLFGGNTGDMTVGNILGYPNGAYTGDAAFNTSIVFENPDIAPEIVERGETEYNGSTAYHVSYYDPNECVSLKDFSDNRNKYEDGEEYPNIVLQPGEYIEVDYGWWDGTRKFGEKDTSVVLIYDAALRTYYPIDSYGYSTSEMYNKKYYKIPLDDLKTKAKFKYNE